MPAIIFWICLCAYLNCAGWTLSALGELNAAGYGVALALGVGGWLAWYQRCRPALFPELRPAKLRRRFRRGFPLAFLALAGLALLGGALYAPANYDALAYRTPRVLHWLSAGHWFWLDTEFQRLNTRTAAFEWLTAPQFLFLHTDRLVFLLNIVAFLLLPGRFFAVLTRLGVRPRQAWHWMWLFPSGYGYTLQAGSIADDMFGAMMALAAFEFALRAGRDKKVSALWIALMAAALMTAIKAYNLLLLLPFAMALLPALKLLLRRPAITVAVILLAATASLLPTAVLNWRQCHDWTGLAAEQPTIGGSGRGYRLLANVVTLSLVNVMPPVFPFTAQWNKEVAKLVPPGLAAKLRDSGMETSLANFELPEMQVEESSGLGAGLTLFILAVAIQRFRRGEMGAGHIFSFAGLFALATWASLFVFMAQVGAAGPARYLLPFYPLLAAPALAGPTSMRIFQGRLGRGAAWVVFGVTALLLVLSPPRPLWPAASILRSLDAANSRHRLLRRANDVYAAYAARSDGLAPVIAALPPEVHQLGYLAFDEPETSLWRPFGSRQILHFSHTDTAADLQARDVKYVLLSEYTLVNRCHETATDWMEKMHAAPVQHFELKLLARQEAHGWWLVRLP